MERSTLMTSMVVAVLLSLLAIFVLTLLSAFYDLLTASRLTLLATGYLYVLYLLSTRRAPGGRLLLALLAAASLVTTFWFTTGLLVTAGAAAGSIWLVRISSAYRSPLPALADAGICLVGLAAGIGAGAESGSIVFALWCFFLIQGLWIVLPEQFRHADGRPDFDRREFDTAAAAAAVALSQLQGESGVRRH